MHEVIVGAIIAILVRAIDPLFAEKAKDVVTSIKLHRETRNLDSPEQIAGRIAEGSLRSGDLVTGTAFFTPYAVSHIPTGVPSPNPDDLKRAMLRVLTSGKVRDFGNPPKLYLPTTRFPYFDDVKRLGFLHPHRMTGFVVPMIHDGTPLTLPVKYAQPIIIRESDLTPAIEHKIVKYRARLATIPISAMREVLQTISDETYEKLRTEGRLYTLHVEEPNTFIEYYEPSISSQTLGATFLQTHWELDQDRTTFFNANLGHVITTTCSELDLGTPQAYKHSSEGQRFWSLPGGIVFQEPGVPHVNIHVNTALDSGPEKERVDKLVAAFGDALIRRINQKLDIQTHTHDLDGTSDYRDTRHTILTSATARSIQDPVLEAVRNWLSKDDGK